MQALSLLEFPRLLPEPEARRLFDELVRGPDRGVSGVSRYGDAGILLWAPLDGDQTHRMLASYQQLLTTADAPANLILIVICDPFPDIQSAEVLFDLWNHPLLQPRWSHINSVDFLHQPARCAFQAGLAVATRTRASRCSISAQRPDHHPLGHWRGALPCSVSRVAPFCT